MKINLINPGQLGDNGKLVRLRQEWTPGLTLPYLAALIPPGHDIKIIEDSVQEINYEEPVDLVGITAMTSRVSRGYQIAAEYRRRRVPVIMGGFHASFMTGEALKHCDAVVVGEAEGLFESILADLEKGELKKTYRRDSWHNLENLPLPRYDMLDFDNYVFPLYPVQAVRGCPNQCEFCSVTAFYGNKYRHRPVGDVVRDAEQAGPLVLFIDDNLTADEDYAIELFREIKRIEKFWIMQTEISIANNERLLELASEAGCFACYTGIETLRRKNLNSMGKMINQPEEYREAIRRLKHHHIELFASIIVGFENERPEHFDQLNDFLLQAKIPFLCTYILTPVPGSKLYDKYYGSKENEAPAWENFDGCHVTLPATPERKEEVEKKYWEIQKQFYSWPSIIRRLLFPTHLAMIFSNWLTGKKVRKHIHPWKGIPVEMNFGVMARIISFISTSPRARRLSRRIRFPETSGGRKGAK